MSYKDTVVGRHDRGAAVVAIGVRPGEERVITTAPEQVFVTTVVSEAKKVYVGEEAFDVVRIIKPTQDAVCKYPIDVGDPTSSYSNYPSGQPGPEVRSVTVSLSMISDADTRNQLVECGVASLKLHAVVEDPLAYRAGVVTAADACTFKDRLPLPTMEALAHEGTADEGYGSE
jgi:hypothetical protein